MATAISSWRDDIAANVSVCPNPTIDSNVLETIREFCVDTRLWDDNALTAIDIVSGTASYSITSAAGDIVVVDRVAILDSSGNDTPPLSPRTKDELDIIDRLWRTKTADYPLQFIARSNKTVQLVYTPSLASTAGLKIWVMLKPLKTATDVEDFIWDDHRECIKFGAMSKLLKMRAMPWFDPELSEYYENEYKNALVAAQATKDTGITEKEIVATPRFFA